MTDQDNLYAEILSLHEGALASAEKQEALYEALFGPYSEEEKRERLEAMGLDPDSYEYVWDQLEYESLDETPEDFDTVDYKALGGDDLEEIRSYSQFKRELGMRYATAEDGGFDEDLYREFESLVVDDHEGHQFFLAHIADRPSGIDWDASREAFLEHQMNLGTQEDMHRRLLAEQQQEAGVVDVTSQPMKLPTSQRLRVTQKDLDD